MFANLFLRSMALAVLAIVGMVPPAFAESLSIRVEPPDAEKLAAANTHWNVFLEGEIDVGDSERVRQELAQVGDEGADVYFDSPGGSLVDGLRIGSLLRHLGATTSVGKPGARGSGIEPGRCFSACAIAFLGGVYRYVPNGSAYGVHRVATTAPSAQDFDAGQIVAARVSRYIRDMGVDSRLFDRMASAGTDRIYVLGSAELHALRVVNDGRLPAEWTSDVSADGPSLTGTQQTASGKETASFSCDDHAVVFRSIYQAGSNAAAIASGQWVHSLMVDEVPSPLAAPTAIEDDGAFLTSIFPLTPDQARRISRASSVGHSMQGARGDPASLGYKIDIDADAARLIREFMESCAPPR